MGNWQIIYQAKKGIIFVCNGNRKAIVERAKELNVKITNSTGKLKKASAE